MIIDDNLTLLYFVYTLLFDAVGGDDTLKFVLETKYFWNSKKLGTAKMIKCFRLNLSQIVTQPSFCYAILRHSHHELKKIVLLWAKDVSSNLVTDLATS